MGPQEIMNSIENTLDELTAKNDELVKLGKEKALADRNYRIAKRKKILELRLDKTPVNIISDLVKGDEEISELNFKKSVSETLYFACLESISNLRLKLETKRSFLTWKRAEYLNT